MVTSRDVARAAGVSQTTVSRVLQRSPLVRPELRDRVLKAFDELGYTPNAVARAMKTQRADTIGVVAANLTNPFYPEVVEALSNEISRRGKRLLLWNTAAAGEESATSAIRERLVDGVIFTTSTLDSAVGETPLVEALRRGAPCVLVTRGVPDLACDQVLSDNRGGAQDVARLLVEAGHRRIGFLAGPESASSATERREGFIDGLLAAGFDVDGGLLIAEGDFSQRSGAVATERWLADNDPPTAIFCVNDIAAFGALGAARRLGVDIPSQLWVIGFNDIAQAGWPALDLSTVRQQLDRMAERAVELLCRRIDGDTSEAVTERLPTSLVLRGTTDPALRTDGAA
jgi:LacI family transcriptional regulator